MIYGPGAVGKTCLANSAPRPTFFDFDHSGHHFDLKVIPQAESWADMRDALHTPSLWEDVQTIIVDSATAGAELALAHTLATVMHEKTNKPVDSIEGYGFGKGYRFLYDTLLCLLSDLEEHAAKGRHVVLVCHSTKEVVDNPEGENYSRYEPDLPNPTRTGRFRDRVISWTDHLFFVNHDIFSKDGKAIASSSRSIRCLEMPYYLAKSRTLRDTIPYPEGSDELWKQLLKGKADE